MKKLAVWAGVLSLAFMLFSCDNGTTGTGTDNTDKPANPFLGTWEADYVGFGDGLVTGVKATLILTIQ
jgi:predicted small secreted protein